MSACAVACNGEFLGVEAIFLGVLLDMEDGAVAILNDIGHSVGLGIAVGVANPSVVYAEHNVLAVLAELASQSFHYILAVHPPASAVDYHHAGELLGSVRDEGIVLESLHARLCIYYVADALVALETLRLNE